MELQSLPFVRASNTVTREEKGARPTPLTVNEASTGSAAAVCSRGATSNSISGPSSMFAPVVTKSMWSTSVCVCRAVPSRSNGGGVEGEGTQHTTLSSVHVLPRPSQLRSRGKGRPRKRGFVGTPVIVDHLAQLRRKEQGFSTGFFGGPSEESCSYDDPAFGGSVTEGDLQTVPSSPKVKRLCTSADLPWQVVRPSRQAPSSSVVDPSLQLSLEDVPTQHSRSNWELYSAPQEGINWASGGPFLQTLTEGSEQLSDVDSGRHPVSGLQEEGACPHSSFTSKEMFSAWDHQRSEETSVLSGPVGALPVPHMEGEEGEGALQLPSLNTDQTSFWLYDSGTGGEEGSGTVGLGGAHSAGVSSDDHLFNVPTVSSEGEDNRVFLPHSHTLNSSTRQHRHWRCSQEESPLIPWEE